MPNFTPTPNQAPLGVEQIRLSMPQISWENWDLRVTAQVRANMRGAADRYLHAYDYGQLNVQFMADHLGFEFDLARNRIHVPPYSKVMAAADHYTEGLIERGEIARQDAIWMGRAFRMPSGAAKCFHFGENIPESAKAIEGYLPGQEWLSLIASRWLPVGEARQLFSMPHLSYPEHELMHLIPMMRHPKYMAAFAQMAEKRCGMRATSSGEQENFDRRLYMLVEILSVIDHRQISSLRDVLRVSPEIIASEVHVRTLEAQYRSLSAQELSQLSAEIATWLELHGDNIGAVFGTPITPDFHPSFKVEHDRAQFLARIGVYLLRASEISPERFIREGLETPMDRNSRTYRLFVQSGIFEEDAHSFWRHVFNSAAYNGSLPISA